MTSAFVDNVSQWRTVVFPSSISRFSDSVKSRSPNSTPRVLPHRAFTDGQPQRRLIDDVVVHERRHENNEDASDYRICSF